MDKSFSKEMNGAGDFEMKNEAFKSNCKHQSPDTLSPVDISRAISEIISTSSSTLDLSRIKLRDLKEEDLFQVPNIKHLHLQGNLLSRIPEDFFQQLSSLVWLDLRFNRLTSLPPGVGAHRHLKSLLLEGNPIKALPVELGDLTSLKALNLRNCPLEFPPIDVVQRGLHAILSFLQNARAGKPGHMELSIPEMPPVEKLKLADLMKSSLELSEEWPNEEEMKLFQHLKRQIMQNEKEEFIRSQPFAIQGGLWGESSSNTKDFKKRLTHTARKKTTLNDPSMYDVQIQNKRHEERKQAALKELKEKQSVFEQRKRDQELLNEWRKQTKKMQEKKEIKDKSDNACRFPPAVRDQVAKNAPYATDLGSKPQEGIRRSSAKLQKEFGQTRTSRDAELEHRIKQHIQMMQEQRKRPKVAPLSDMQKAKEDLETAELLQRQLAKMKEEDVPLEYRFTAFTGEVSPAATPRVQPQNIFSKMQF
ncbi:leucine-rich repeat-containing protein 27 isoform X1 [Ambystoma mexicanum]|uniref:leucine-rich repeat-containing protein 27 isoform X1 n=1 Tax=Ambystoma mexicanum TaxID=8296 RepID=UPI0037E9BB79